MLVLGLLGIAALVALVGPPDEGTMAFELRKGFIQFLLIVALGAVVTYVVEILRRKRDARERERQNAIDAVTLLLRQLDAVYRKVKRRRRGFVHAPLSRLTKEAYVDGMWKLSKDKEDVGQLVGDMEALEPWLPELKPIRGRVESMEGCLKELTDEWEKWEKSRESLDDDFGPERVPKLTAFSMSTEKPEGASTRESEGKSSSGEPEGTSTGEPAGTPTREPEGKSSFRLFWTSNFVARRDLIGLLAKKRTGVSPRNRTERAISGR